MSNAWQQGMPENRPEGWEPYPGFGGMHEEYYRQYRQSQQDEQYQQAQQAAIAWGKRVTTWRILSPFWRLEPMPGISQEKHEELVATIRQKQRKFYLCVAIAVVAVGSAVYRAFT